MRLPLTLPRSRAIDALCVGLNSIDLLAEVDGYPAPDSKAPLAGFSQRPGGQAASTAVGLARLGHSVGYIGRVGDDAFGRDALSSLEAEGVLTEGVIRVEDATSQFAVVLVDRREGTRTVLWHRHAGLTMRPTDVPAAAVSAARVLHVDCHETAAVTAAAEAARASGTRTVVDVEKVRPGTERLLASMDVVIAAEAFPGDWTGVSETGAALAALQDACGAAVVCVTLGSEGSLARVQGREVRTPAFSVPVVDTTGAGDAFRAGFVGAWLHGGDETEVEDALRWGNAVAALKCRAPGARTALPRLAELRAFLGESM